MFIKFLRYIGKASKYIYATLAAYKSCKILKIFYITYASPSVINIIYAIYKSGEFITLVYTIYKTLTYKDPKEVYSIIITGFIRRIIFDDKPINLLSLVKPEYNSLKPFNLLEDVVNSYNNQIS